MMFRLVSLKDNAFMWSMSLVKILSLRFQALPLQVSVITPAQGVEWVRSCDPNYVYDVTVTVGEQVRTFRVQKTGKESVIRVG